MIRKLSGKIVHTYRTRRWFRWGSDVLIVLLLMLLVAFAHGVSGRLGTFLTDVQRIQGIN